MESPAQVFEPVDWRACASMIPSVLISDTSSSSDHYDEHLLSTSDWMSSFGEEEEPENQPKKRIKTCKTKQKEKAPRIRGVERVKNKILKLKSDFQDIVLIETCAIASSFGNFFANALNSCSIDDLQLFFKKFCRSDCSIIHQVYAFESLSLKQNCKIQDKTEIKINPFGNFTSFNFPSKEFFYSFMSNFYSMVPDAIFTVSNHRCCYEQETSLYMSAFEWSGTIITKDSILIAVDPITQLAKCVDKPVHMDVMVSDENAVYPLIMKGSIAFYVDRSGLIYCLEFFYECLQDFDDTGKSRN